MPVFFKTTHFMFVWEDKMEEHRKLKKSATHSQHPHSQHPHTHIIRTNGLLICYRNGSLTACVFHLHWTLWNSVHEIVLFSLPGPGLSQWGGSKPRFALPFTMGKILQHYLFTQDDIKHNLSKRSNVSLTVHYEHSEWRTVVDWALLKACSMCHSGVC